MRDPGGESGWERLFWLVFERTSNPIAVLDEQRRIIELNDAALALFGRKREELVGTSIVENIRPAERAAAARDWQAFLHTREYSGTRALVRTDGSEVQIDFAARLENVGGQRRAIYVALPPNGPPRRRRTDGAEPVLTAREREVVTLIAMGRETDQIAAELHISPQTVRTHVRNAMSKLGAHTRAQLVAIALCTDDAVHSAHVERVGS